MNGFEPENLGQMNLYVNYFRKEVNEEDDNKPIGIILCSEKDGAIAEYTIDGVENNIYPAKYTYIMPNKKELEDEINKYLGK